ATVLIKTLGGKFRKTVALLSAARAGKSPDSGLRLIRATVLIKTLGGKFRKTVALLSAARAGKSPDSGSRLIRTTVLMKPRLWVAQNRSPAKRSASREIPG
ncbi:hypothetical protein PGO24_09430, partial [Klebsiella aerogenes]